MQVVWLKKQAIILFKVQFFRRFPPFPADPDNGFSRSAPRYDKTCVFSISHRFRRCFPAFASIP
jgi:hypothetical protein